SSECNNILRNASGKNFSAAHIRSKHLGSRRLTKRRCQAKPSTNSAVAYVKPATMFVSLYFTDREKKKKIQFSFLIVRFFELTLEPVVGLQIGFAGQKDRYPCGLTG
ncbi:hypothetical protein BDV26DRAFT_254101, partial [Aspergillus bertholletiae]